MVVGGGKLELCNLHPGYELVGFRISLSKCLRRNDDYGGDYDYDYDQRNDGGRGNGNGNVYKPTTAPKARYDDDDDGGGKASDRS